MPIKYIKYGCKFKCGHKHIASKDEMQIHEAKCWYNPALKTCKTCVHEDYYVDRDDFKSWQVRECKIDEMNQFIDEHYDDLYLEKSGGILPILHCKYHKSNIS
jgi:hypothetical protein